MAAGGVPFVDDVPRKAEGWKSSEDQRVPWRKKMKEKRRGNDLRSENGKEEGKVIGDCSDGIGGGWAADLMNGKSKWNDPSCLIHLHSQETREGNKGKRQKRKRD